MPAPRITSSYPSTPLQGSLCRRCGCWSLQRKTALEQASCLSKKPKYGEAGAWPGGDKEDEGGGHRNCESPYQGLYLDNALGFIVLGIKSHPFEVCALSFKKKVHEFLCRRAARARKIVSSSTSSLAHSAFSSWLCFPQFCAALSTLSSWPLLYLSSC